MTSIAPHQVHVLLGIHTGTTDSPFGHSWSVVHRASKRCMGEGWRHSRGQGYFSVGFFKVCSCWYTTCNPNLIICFCLLWFPQSWPSRLHLHTLFRSPTRCYRYRPVLPSFRSGAHGDSALVKKIFSVWPSRSPMFQAKNACKVC